MREERGHRRDASSLITRPDLIDCSYMVRSTDVMVLDSEGVMLQFTGDYVSGVSDPMSIVLAH